MMEDEAQVVRRLGDERRMDCPIIGCVDYGRSSTDFSCGIPTTQQYASVADTTFPYIGRGTELRSVRAMVEIKPGNDGVTWDWEGMRGAK